MKRGVRMSKRDHNPADKKRPLDSEPEKETAEERRKREEALDKTIADSFPTSDPPSSIPDPDSEDAA